MRGVVWRVLGVLAAVLLCSTAAQAAVVPRDPIPADPLHDGLMIADAPSTEPFSTTPPPGRLERPATVTTAANGSAFDPDSVLMLLDVQANGSTTWQVEYRFQLSEDGEADSFTSFRQDIEQNTSRYTARFADRIRPSVTAAQRETGREMAVENVTVAVRRQQLARPTGIVTYTFTWQQFANRSESAIRIGDAIRGFYVGPATTLTVTWPTEYTVARTIPEPDRERKQRLSWQGELGFGADEPLVLVQSTQATPTDGATNATPADASAGGVSLLLLGAAGLLLVALGAGGVVAARTRGDESASADSTAADADEGSAVSAPDDDLLSDEERALAVVEEQGGRIKQQQLADACEWNDSKVSRVVNSLREDGDVSVFRLGRENVISLPEDTDER